MSDPLILVRTVVNLMKDGSISPKVAMQMMQSIIQRLVANSIAGTSLVLDQFVCLT